MNVHPKAWVDPIVRKDINMKDLAAEMDKKWKELTKELSKENESMLILAPSHIGADSTDMEVFVTDIYNRPVSDKNYKNVASLFRQWFEATSPEQYQEPDPDSLLRHTHGGARLNALARNPLKRRTLVCSNEVWNWLKDQGNGTAAQGIRSLYMKGNKMWVYKLTEPGLFTVGFYSPSGEWHSDFDFNSKMAAAERVSYLNGEIKAEKIKQSLQNFVNNVERNTECTQ